MTDLIAKRRTSANLTKSKSCPQRKEALFFLSVIWVLYKKKIEWESFLIALSSRRNKCQVATILLNFFFLSLHWMGENYPICPSITRCFSGSQRCCIPLSLHCYRMYQSSVHGSSVDFWWKHTYCWEFMEVALRCPQMYTLNEFWQIN